MNQNLDPAPVIWLDGDDELKTWLAALLPSDFVLTDERGKTADAGLALGAADGPEECGSGRYVYVARIEPGSAAPDILARFPLPFRAGSVIDALYDARRRLALEAGAVRALGKWCLSARENTLRPVNGEAILLTEKERGILQALLDAPAHTLERGDLLSSVWQYASDVETHTIETHIYRLRRKIEEDPANPSRLVTVQNAYRLETGEFE